MWSRRELKERGKLTFKRFYWKAVLVSFICLLLSGGIGSGVSNKVSDSLSSSMHNNYYNDSYLYDDEYNNYYEDLDSDLYYMEEAIQSFFTRT